MFDIGGGELLVIGIVALVVIGPKELPGLLRTVGNAMGKVRRMAAEFRGQFDDAMREAELDQAKKAFTDMNDVAQSVKPSFNPLDTIRNEIQSVKDEMKVNREAATPAPAPTPPLPEPKFDPPPPAPPVDIKAPAPAPAGPAPAGPAPAPVVAAAPEAKPKSEAKTTRSRKKADSEGAAS